MPTDKQSRHPSNNSAVREEQPLKKGQPSNEDYSGSDTITAGAKTPPGKQDGAGSVQPTTKQG